MKKIMYFALSVLLTLCACSSTEPENKSDDPVIDQPTNENQGEEVEYLRIQLTDGDFDAREKGIDFSFKLNNLLEQSNKVTTGNYVYSPFSMYMSLSLFSNTEISEARTAVLDALGYNSSDADIKDLNHYCALLYKTLPTLDPSSTMKIANAIFYQRPVNPVFAEKIKSYYGENGCVLNNVPNTQDAWKDINLWISDKTGGYVNNLISADDPLEMVVNAGYFNASWTDAFDEKDTREDYFTNADGTKSKIPFMHKDISGQYMRDTKWEAISLPFGNGQYSMTFLLPRTQDADLNTTEYMYLLNSTKIKNLVLSIPKFTEELKIDSWFNILGFDNHNMALSGFFANDDDKFEFNAIKQKVKLAISEEGAEGGFATVNYIITMGGDEPLEDPDEVIEFKLNRPFYYMIQETSTRTILFMGKRSSF